MVKKQNSKRDSKAAEKVLTFIDQNNSRTESEIDPNDDFDNAAEDQLDANGSEKSEHIDQRFRLT